jgi:ATP-dependent Lon protease
MQRYKITIFKNVCIYNKQNKTMSNIHIMENTIEYIHNLLDIVKNTSTGTHYYKLLNFLDTREVLNCMLTLQTIATNLKNVLELLENHTNVDEASCATAVADLARELLATIKICGTYNLEDLFYLLLAEQNTNLSMKNVYNKYILLNQFAHPVSFEELLYSEYKHLDCIQFTRETGSNASEKGSNASEKGSNASETASSANTNTILLHKAFNFQVHCVKVVIRDHDKIFLITCLIDDIHLEIVKNDYITLKINNLQRNAGVGESATLVGESATLAGESATWAGESATWAGESATWAGESATSASACGLAQWYDYLQTPLFQTYKSCLTLKDLLTYSEQDIHNNYISFTNNISRISEKSIGQVVEEFIYQDLYHKRVYLMHLLINTSDQEAQYLAYLLYDLLSNDLNGNVDTIEQTLLFDSFPFKVKQLFHNAMRETVNYTKKLSNTDLNNIPLEQRICLLKTSDAVKEKAMIKLKEIKAKGDDSGSKPRHYLEGLLKIPFKVMKEEPILRINSECIQLFTTLIQNVSIFPKKQTYNSFEVHQNMHILKTQGIATLYQEMYACFEVVINTASRKILLELIKNINIHTKTHHETKIKKISTLNKKNPQLRLDILQLGKTLLPVNTDNNLLTGPEGLSLFTHFFAPLNDKLHQHLTTFEKVTHGIQIIETKRAERHRSLVQVKQTLDSAVYGHATAKRQLERIIGQWINGENKGYCFGFEGPPGVGKTSLAKKGIADCLKDADGQSRPFSFIAIGGSANGSTLEGHNYTYVGSTWGKVVDILMEKKCMNPIIFIDELDKVSKTEHGKEIISILTHLVDPSQNDTFQDKYFSGIDIDVSNILFVFSYNDAQLIDKILLDRIHRIKFDNLSLAEKVVIAQEFILPDIYKKMGLTDVLVMEAAEIEFIIEEYTAESGVRKLKELLFDIVGEINLELLANEVGANEVGTNEVGANEVGTNEVGTNEVGTNEVGTNEVGANEVVIKTLPIKITKQAIVDKYLKDRDAVKIATVHPVSIVGCINGLWANALGKGGVLPIEANYYPASTFLDLRLTGMQGDVMKESMSVAKTLAWSLLTNTEQKALDVKQGIHIHVPEGATPKDGPSAGTAITVVMYSLFTQKPIKHDLAITGEICLSGRVTAIGGLDLKILGGIKAGVKTFLFPKENLKDLEKLKKKYGDKSFFQEITFFPVEDIKEVFKHVF